MRRTPVLLGTATVVLLVCGASPVKPDDPLAKRLLDAAGNQKAKIRALAKRGVPHLAKLLASKDRITRIAALMALGEAKDDAKAAVRLLTARCKGKDWEDAYFALIALARRRASEANALIRRFAAHKEPRLREAACFAIAEFGARALHPQLDELLDDTSKRVQGAAGAAKGIIERNQRRH